MLSLLSRQIFFLVAVSSFAIPTAVRAQDSAPPPAASAASPDDAYQAQRKFAIALLNQQKHIEALPVFESLAKQHPDDPEVLFGWGACLVTHSATVADPDAARQERLHARQLLLRAKELGKNSNLLLNLLDLLPADGSAPPFSSATGADSAMRAGEAAFAKNDYDEAIKNYSHALELDPKNYDATLFVGDSYFAKKDFPNALIWYDRAIALNPNADSAYRYEADMLIKSGEMEKARARSIQAVVSNPYSQITWRALNYWATSNHLQLSQLKIKIPGGVERKDDQHINITLSPKVSGASIDAAWAAYGMSRAYWMGDNFKKNFPKDPQYRHSLLEESESLKMAAEVLSGKGDRKKHASEYEKDPDVSLLLKLYDAKMIEPYVLISAPDRDIALNDYAPYREQHRDLLEAYLSQFVVPPTPPKP
ncbi:MAG TPA: tetratricopeptide repeat protein [Candidatus Acidoferrum sp.]|nr:tetratricopeptide repeat protein [Candidatus Acidoferrum sp.]